MKNISTKKSVSKLEQDDYKYKKLFETAGDAIFVMDMKRIVKECNNQAVKIFGCDKKSDLVGSQPFNYFLKNQPDGQSSKAKAKKYMTQAMKGKPVSFYWQSTKKNGEPFDCEVSLNRLFLHDGKYVLAIVRDISAKVEAENKLKASENKFKTIVNSSRAIIFMYDQDLKLILSAGEDLKKLGLKPNQFIGKTVYELYEGTPGEEDYIKDFEQALNGKFSRRTSSSADGDVYFDTFVSPYRDEKGNRFVIGMGFDVTEQEKAKIKLKELDQVKTEFMNIAAHQLRTPAGSIRWSLERVMGLEQVDKDPILKSEIKKIYRTNLRIISLVDDLLKVVRLDQAEEFWRGKRIKIKSVVDEILEDLRPEIKRKKIQLTCVCPEAELEVKANKKLLKEAMKNIFLNAVKYNKESGKILTEIKKEKEKVKIAVANTGLIISKEDQDRIFDKFYRSPGAVKKETVGTGLGLFLARSYLEKIGGKISFVSPKRFGGKSLRGIKYKGTLFTVTLPLKNSKKT